jgi:hypothetical protein
VPAVDLSREASIVTVTPNGGNSEVFHVDIPADRIMLGAVAGTNSPDGMQWPRETFLEGTQTELFKLRNARNAVIGVASRIAVRDATVGDVIEWTLHFPARGSLYVSLPAGERDGLRRGILRAGTREFADLAGSLSERWVDGGPTGPRVELVATYVASSAGEEGEAAQ